MIYKVFFFSFILTFPILTFSSVFDAHFIDQLTDHYRINLKLVELIQDKGMDLDFKRMTRKLMRREKSELKQMSEWRNSYFDNIGTSHEWIGPERLDNLRKFNGKKFDREALRLIMAHQKTVLKLLQEGLEHSDMVFLKEFVKDRLEDTENEIKEMKKLQEVQRFPAPFHLVREFQALNLRQKDLRASEFEDIFKKIGGA